MLAFKRALGLFSVHVNGIVLILRRAFSSKSFIFRGTHGKTGVTRVQHPFLTGHAPE